MFYSIFYIKPNISFLGFHIRVSFLFPTYKQISFLILSNVKVRTLFHYIFYASIVLDATAKIPTGLLDGTIADYGEYEECLNIKVTEEEPLTINGKYCMALISTPIPPKPEILTFHKPILNVSQTPLKNTIWELLAKMFNFFYMSKGFRAGLCVPSTCSAQEIQSIASGSKLSMNHLNE